MLKGLTKRLVERALEGELTSHLGYEKHAVEGRGSGNSRNGAFPNPDSVRKVLYLAIQKASARWARPIKDWVAALNHFTMVFEGRVPNR